jgi:antitoxin component of MazEF toxin-antitoxin module
MRKQVSYCIFGDERLLFAGKQELPEGTLWTWESPKKDEAGNSMLRLQILSKADLIKRTTITESKNGKAITTAFDSSCNLIRDPEFANNADYMLLTRNHAGKLDSLMDRVRTLYQLHSPRELFRIREIRKLDEAEGKKPAPQEFPNITKVVDAQNNAFVIYPPIGVIHAMGFENGSLAEVTSDGKSLVLTPLKKRQYNVKTFMRGDSLQVNLPRELVQLNGIYANTPVEVSKEGPMRLSMRPVSKQDERASVVHYIQQGNVHEVTIPKTFNMRAGLYGVWTDEGEKLVLELSESPMHIIRVRSTDRVYSEQFSLYVPKELAEKIDMKNWEAVGFAINGQGQLVMTLR